MTEKKCIALVGRPNVGKSRLFNRLSGTRRSIVHDQPGITRDIIAADLAGGITLLDTGGISGERDNDLKSQVDDQITLAISLADILLFVLDGREGITLLDQQIADRLRKTGKKIIPVVNKIDSSQQETQLFEFFQLGFPEQPIALSAEHNRGMEELTDLLGLESTETGHQLVKPPTIALVGAPNVGKSSLTNGLLGNQRTIVNEVAGTTRDSIHASFQWPIAAIEHTFQLIDTAGIRPKNSVSSPVEFFSQLRTQQAIDEADVIFLVLDAARGLTKFDKKIIDRVAQARKCLVLTVNKWDLAKGQFRNEPLERYDSLEDFQQDYEKQLRAEVFSWPKIPIIFLAAINEEGLSQIPETTIRLMTQNRQQFSTGRLNRCLEKIISRRGPAKINGKQFKLFYAVQTTTNPCRIRIFCNQQRLLDRTYEAYLKRALTEEFGLFGCHLGLEFVSKPPRQR